NFRHNNIIFIIVALTLERLHILPFRLSCLSQSHVDITLILQRHTLHCCCCRRSSSSRSCSTETQPPPTSSTWSWALRWRSTIFNTHTLAVTELVVDAVNVHLIIVVLVHE